MKLQGLGLKRYTSRHQGVSLVSGKLAEKLLKDQHLNLQKLPIESISRRQLQEGYAVLQVPEHWVDR